MKQIGMFGTRPPTPEPMPPHNGTVTSQAAAASVHGSVTELRERVFRYIKEQGWAGATDQEVQEALQMDGNTQRPRRVELANERRIVRHGTRKTKSGRGATVWVVNPVAKANDAG